jgi:hypothetical protein
MLLDLILGAAAVFYALKAMKFADLEASRRQLTLWFGTHAEAEEARQAPQGTLHAGAPPGAATDSKPGNLSV